MSKHTTPPITSEQFKALSKEEKELYGPEVYEASPYKGNRYSKVDISSYISFQKFGFAVRKMHYPLPVESQQPEQVKCPTCKCVNSIICSDGWHKVNGWEEPITAPLINEGGETVEELKLRCSKMHPHEAEAEIFSQLNFSDNTDSPAVAAYEGVLHGLHFAKTEVTTLQTALAEKDKRIKELASAANFALNKIYTLINTPKGLRNDLLVDATKADMELRRALRDTSQPITLSITPTAPNN